jgi:hypothetical protein
MIYAGRYAVGFCAISAVALTMAAVCALLDRNELRHLVKVWHEDKPIRGFAREYARNEV